jgi:ligand-binding sensor domain-containing protein
MIRSQCLFILSILPLLAGAQPVFKNLNNENGLSNNTVLTILQDRKGFMWFGTDDGLNKYDGHTFRIFKPDFKSKRGISHNIAKILFEDHAGNIWIGTDGGGLNKFNPVTEEFTNFYFEESNLTGLNHNNVTALAEEKDRYLWIGTYGGGLNRLDLDTYAFEYFVNEEGNANTVASQFINSLVFDDKGFLWIGTWGRGLDRLDVSAMTFTNFQHDVGDSESLSDNTVNHIYIDANKKIWIGTWEGGLNLFHPETQTFSHYNAKEKTLSTNNVRHLCGDRNGNLWLASFGDGLVRFNTGSEAFQNYRYVDNLQHNGSSLCSNNLWTSYFSIDNILWIGSIEGGISKLDFSRNRFFNIKNVTNDLSEPDVIDAVMETSSGEILAGTFGKGLVVLGTDLHTINNSLSHIPLLSNKITSIMEDSQGIYWISTDGGITTYDPRSKTVKNHVIVGTKPGLSFSNTKTIYEDRAGTIWIGTWGGGLNRYDKKTDAYNYYFGSPKLKVTFTVDMGEIPISSKGVFLAGNFNNWNTRTIPMKQVGAHIFKVTLELYAQKIEFRFLNGDVWETVPSTCAFLKNRLAEIGNANLDIGIIKYGKSCHKMQAVDKTFASGLTNSHVWSIAEDHDGNLWVGTNEGLNRFDKINNVFTPYRSVNGDSTALSDNHVSCIYEDKDLNLWVGTLGGGINLYDKKSNTFVNFSEKDGLANNLVKAILEDDHHNLWISTNNGISRFNYKTRQFKNYNQANGLENNTYRIGAACRRKNGEMLFGGTHGLSRFNPDSVSSNLYWPKVYITDVLLSGQSLSPAKVINNVVLDTAVLYANNINLSYDQNMLTFKFASPDFSGNGEPQFSYKLEGFDRQWYDSRAADHLASYTNLPPGNYRFLVRVSNQEGLFGNSRAQLNVFISPPFWQTSIFKLTIALFFALGLYIVYKIIAAKKEEKLRQATMLANQKIKDLENEKLQNEIDYKNKELATVSMNLIEKTKFLNEQIKRLETIANISENDVKSKLNNLIDNFNKEITTEKDWEYFELHFDKVHQNFLSKLKTTFPDLSAVDIRLAAFIKMDLSNKEIADLMNKSVRSIESSRYRLRKSLHLNQGDNLSDFIFRL